MSNQVCVHASVKCVLLLYGERVAIRIQRAVVGFRAYTYYTAPTLMEMHGLPKVLQLRFKMTQLQAST